ncbi:MAG TPA: hypothetical protein VJ739_19375 [Gemmataceae bacterium]|nr:hypothetical protein [Gemmataceae bacterium]
MQAVSSPQDTPRPRRTRRNRPSVNGANGAHAAQPGAPSANGDNGRDARGRFTKGNPGGPGNPFNRQLAALRKALVATVTEDDIRAVTAELLRRARDGDVLAIRLLFAYVIGRPTDAVDPDTLDQQEWDLYRKHPARGQDVIDLMQTLPPQMACFLVRTTVPYVGQALADGLREQFEAERAAADRAGDPAVEELLG